jgi:hypothetical protein
MKKVYKIITQHYINFRRAHQLTSCWTYRALALLDFEHESSSVICKHSLEIGKSKCEIQSKQPVLLNVCQHNFFHSFVTQSFVRYVIDLIFHFLFLNITSPLIDFRFFKKKYTWRNSKTDGRSCSNILIHCKHSVPTWRLLFRLLICIATITVSVILQQFRRLASLGG